MIGAAVVLPAAVHETLQAFWESPFPPTLQGKQFRIVDVNDAFLELSLLRARGARRLRPDRAAA